ncbi:MAG: glycogen debranching protein [Croceitalea sp.]|nr:glycogen debranching protein [Croceitalea sp.]
MVNLKHLFLLCLCLVFLGCNKQNGGTIQNILKDTPHINGKESYLASPYVTAGNRVYMVGHQDGSFPDLGWHIKGEMGGIWNHPIKLMDGFDLELSWPSEIHLLNKADTFTNYPFANKHDFIIKDKSLKITRWQFVPDNAQGLVVQLIIHNEGESNQEFILKFTGHSDLRPTWLGERTQMVNAQDEPEYSLPINGWLIKDNKNPWYVAFTANEKPLQKFQSDTDQEKLTASASLQYAINLEAGATKVITFSIAGSYTSQTNVENELKNIQHNYVSLLRQKKTRYEKLANYSKLTIPDKHLEQTFEWLKYNCDWLVRSVPEIGTGITAGMPDYPWWFGVDSEYALQGYMAVGQKKAVYTTIALLDSVSKTINGNGKIIHEMSTNGSVFNSGNINETPQFASLIWRIYQWNGDLAFLKKYFPTIKNGLQWLMEHNDTDNNLFPEGFGMMEIHGLDSEMIDVASYTQKAFSDAAKIAEILEDKDLSNKYQDIANTLKDNINGEFWSESFGSYADFIGTDEQALHLIEDAMIRADTLNKPWAKIELETTKKYILNNPSSEPRPFVMHHNWVVNTPMEMGIADPEKALNALQTAEKYVNPFGVFVTGIDRDESAGSDDGSFKGSKVFSYTGAVMTLPTGVQAIAENNYGRPDQALNYLNRMARTFSYALPGSMYEVSPDYGMMVQAWNIYSFAYPIVHQFFGMQPNAAQKEVIIRPQMPSSWSEASLEHILVADNEVSIYYLVKNGKTSIKVSQTNEAWTIKLQISKKAKEIEAKHGSLSEEDEVYELTNKGKWAEIEFKH